MVEADRLALGHAAERIEDLLDRGERRGGLRREMLVEALLHFVEILGTGEVERIERLSIARKCNSAA